CALVPAALCGADVTGLLNEAAGLISALHLGYDNPGLVLGAVLGRSVYLGRDKLLLAEGGAEPDGFGGWVHQFIPASPGKDGPGIAAAVGGAPPRAGGSGGVRGLVSGGPAEGVDLAVSGPLGARFLLWEYAAAVACRVIGVNPFARPAVRESEDSIGGLL